MKTLNVENNVFNQQSANSPTGIHQATSWLAKGLAEFNKGLTIEIDTELTNIDYLGKSYHVANDVIASAALFEGLQGKGGVTLESMFALWQEGYVAQAQKRFAQSGVTSTPVTPVGRATMSSRDYYINCLGLAVNKDNLTALADILLSGKKTVSVDTLSELFGLTSTQAEQYQHLKQSEEKYMHLLSTLEKAGLKDVKVYPDKETTRFTATYSIEDRSLVIDTLAKLGLVRVGSVIFNEDSDTFTISFKTVIEDNEQI